MHFYSVFFLGLGAAIVALDQWSKHFFRQPQLWPVPGPEQVPQSVVVYDWLWFTYVQNKGALAGIFSAFTPWLGLLSLAVSLGIIVYGLRLPKQTQPLTYWALGFLLGGAAGNMWDRLVYGYVVDFFDIRWQGQNIWPIFNIADIAIDVAIGLFIVQGLCTFVSDRKALPVTDNTSQM